MKKLPIGTKKLLGEYYGKISEEDIITIPIPAGDVTCKMQLVVEPISKSMTEAWMNQCRRVSPEFFIENEVKQ